MSTLMTIVIILEQFLQNWFLIHFIKTSFRQKGDEKFTVNKESATFQE
jgi:hypothetical protein